MSQLNTVFGYIEKRDMAAIRHSLVPGPIRVPSMNPFTRTGSRFTPNINLRADRVYRLRRYILKRIGIFSEHLARFKITKVLKRFRNWPKYVPLKDPELLSDDELELLEKSLHESDLLSQSTNQGKISSATFDYTERSQKLGISENYFYLNSDSEIDHPLAVSDDDYSDISSEDYFDEFVPLENGDKSYFSDQSYKQDSRDDFDSVDKADDSFFTRSDQYIRDFNPFEEFDVKQNDEKDSNIFFNDHITFKNSEDITGHNDKKSSTKTLKIGNGTPISWTEVIKPERMPDSKKIAPELPVKESESTKQLAYVDSRSKDRITTVNSDTSRSASVSTSELSNTHTNPADIFTSRSSMADSNFADTSNFGDSKPGVSTSESSGNPANFDTSPFRPVRTSGNFRSSDGLVSNNDGGSFNSNHDDQNEDGNSGTGSLNDNIGGSFNSNHDDRNGDGNSGTGFLNDNNGEPNGLHSNNGGNSVNDEPFVNHDVPQNNHNTDSNRLPSLGSPLFVDDINGISDQGHNSNRRKLTFNSFDDGPNFSRVKPEDSEKSGSTQGMSTVAMVMLVACVLVGVILRVELNYTLLDKPEASTTLKHQESEEFKVVIDQEKMDEIISNFYSHSGIARTL